jgi:hypothetical protein
MQKYEARRPNAERASMPYPRWCFAPGVPFRKAVTEAMSMPMVMEVIAWAAVRPMPMRLLPMVHDERQIPHVPEKSESAFHGWGAGLTPIAHVGVHAVCALVVRDGIDISIAPSARLDGLVLVVGGLDLEALEEI